MKVKKKINIKLLLPNINNIVEKKAGKKNK